MERVGVGSVKVLTALGLDPARIETLTLLHERHGHRVFRVAVTGLGTYILKLFENGTEAIEVEAYNLLRRLRVPTLPLHRSSNNALLLEDLRASTIWRLGAEQDVTRADIGVAVAGWYRRLHAAGRDYLSATADPPGFLRRDTDDLDRESVLRVGALRELAHLPAWQRAADHVEALCAALEALPTTLLYNDFHWSNLAVTCEPPLRAVVYDYHLLGIGPAVSDYRNVLSGLTGDAKQAFIQTYGAMDKRALALDVPLATLYALTVAARAPQLPGWAVSLKASVENGGLENDLRCALAVL